MMLRELGAMIILVIFDIVTPGFVILEASVMSCKRTICFLDRWWFCSIGAHYENVVAHYDLEAVNKNTYSVTICVDGVAHMPSLDGTMNPLEMQFYFQGRIDCRWKLVLLISLYMSGGLTLVIC